MPDPGNATSNRVVTSPTPNPPTGSRAASPIDFAAESAKTHAHLNAKATPKVPRSRIEATIVSLEESVAFYKAHRREHAAGVAGGLLEAARARLAAL